MRGLEGRRVERRRGGERRRRGGGEWRAGVESGSEGEEWKGGDGGSQGVRARRQDLYGPLAITSLIPTLFSSRACFRTRILRAAPSRCFMPGCGTREVGRCVMEGGGHGRRWPCMVRDDGQRRAQPRHRQPVASGQCLRTLTTHLGRQGWARGRSPWSRPRHSSPPYRASYVTSPDHSSRSV